MDLFEIDKNMSIELRFWYTNDGQWSIL